MIIPHRKPCIEAQLRVKGDEQELKNIINDLLRNKKDIGISNINILPSGNAAICVSSKIIKDIYGESNVLVPDMGGWKGFITYSKMFNLNPIKIKTELGIIDPSTLDECIKKYQAKGLFLTSLAGYLTPQPLKEIKKVCEENEILFVEDASGKVGGDCGYGDIIVCSTGAPKIINCEYGGFIGIDKKIKDHLKELGKLEELKSFLKTYKTFNIFGSMKEETLRARKTYKKCVYLSDIIKEEMENAYFEGKEGVSEKIQS